MAAMAPKRAAKQWDRLVYIDLLAGPGRDIDPETDEEFSGSPLIALEVRPAFDHLFLADTDPENVEALRRRIPSSDLTRVTLAVGDCNQVVDDVIRGVSGRTLGMAFIDPEGFEVKFDTLTKLATRRIDLLYLFPSGIGVTRNIANFLKQPDALLMNEFWGGRDWRDLPAAKQIATNSDPTNKEKIFTSFVTAFREKLAKAGFKFRDEAAPLFKNTKNARMYHLLYFSHDAAGLKIWRGIKRIAPGGQRELF